MTDDEAHPAQEAIVEAIDGAEEVRDPLEGLVEKTKADPGAPFAPDVLERLAELKRDDPAAFETLRAELKKAKCRVTALDAALAPAGGDAHGRGPSQADILITLADAAELFHTPDSIAFADLEIDGHWETWPVRSKSFRNWLTRRFYEETGSAPNSEARQAALNVIESKAFYGAPEHVVHVRVGGMDGRIYLDLCDKTWRAVEISSTGWQVIDTPPVHFRRSAGMLPLPIPVAGGSIEELRPFLNVRSNIEFVLAVAWLLAALHDRGPYPVLALFGEQGTAKSTFAKILRLLIDPNTAPLRALPREDRDLFIAATNGHVLVFDNVSALAEWISDTLCRLSTGGGFATRQLYTDQDEVLFDATRPVILNGIEEVVNRPDLADRAIFLTLEPIPNNKRKLEKNLLADFELARPRILGALLDAVVMGLEQLPSITLAEMPRMADFALWASACETALRHSNGTFWDAGTFMKAYHDNLEAVETVLHANLVATAVRAFMEPGTPWSGTATDLLELLGKVAGERATKSKTWPADATRLGGALRRAATFLRKVGIEVGYDTRGKARGITLTTTSTQPVSEAERVGDPASTASTASISSVANDLATTLVSTLAQEAASQRRHVDANGSGGSLSVDASDEANPLKNKAVDAVDAGDAEIPTLAVRKNGGCLSAARIRELAGDYVDAAATAVEETGDVDRIALERALRETLAAEVAPEAVETEFARIMKAAEAF